MRKRLFDFCFSLVWIILLFPFMIIISVLIKLDSSGPVFYRCVRAGKGGEPFKIFKFRTMFVDNGRIEGTTGLNDPRVTRIGKYLRKYKLDELPQLINVLRGKMSIVGPRPELLRYVENYDEREKIILNVKPGLTDISSIEFISLDEYVGTKNFDRVYEEKVLHLKNALRIEYVEKQSFWFDIKLIVKTTLKILSKVL